MDNKGVKWGEEEGEKDVDEIEREILQENVKKERERERERSTHACEIVARQRDKSNDRLSSWTDNGFPYIFFLARSGRVQRAYSTYTRDINNTSSDHLKRRERKRSREKLDWTQITHISCSRNKEGRESPIKWVRFSHCSSFFFFLLLAWEKSATSQEKKKKATYVHFDLENENLLATEMCAQKILAQATAEGESRFQEYDFLDKIPGRLCIKIAHSRICVI